MASVPCPNKCVATSFVAAPPPPNRINNPSVISFPFASSTHPHSNLSATLKHTVRRQASVTKIQAQLGEADIIPKANVIPKESPAPQVIPDAASINAFMAQVSDLVKLVDSRDIVELQLKQQDCELLIRKKEAIPLPPAPVVQPQHSYYAAPSQPQAPQAAAPVPSSPASSAPAALPAPAKPSASSHPPLKCPMAGTFYRCPGPGEPPFVKVGDKVQKGQVICIIEAMKLMNEIEADRSGTVTEILVEDGKPVSVDMPLFVIAP